MLNNNIMWILIILIILFLWNSKQVEGFIAPNEPLKKHPLALKQRSWDYINKTKNLDQKLPPSKCCKIERVMDKNGKWKYDYNKYEGDECKPYDNNIVIPNKIEYYYDDGVAWSNKKMCNSKSKYLGSCRNSFNACMDFIPKEECKKLPAYVWSEKTCRDKIKLPQKFTPYKDFIVFDE